MSVAGSKEVPNDWSVQGAVDLEGQAAWYETMLSACEKRDWIGGMAFWSWTDRLYGANQASQRGDYEIYAKPAEAVVRRHYQSIQGES